MNMTMPATPTDVVEAFLDHLAVGDVEAAWELCSADMRLQCAAGAVGSNQLELVRSGETMARVAMLELAHEIADQGPDHEQWPLVVDVLTATYGIAALYDPELTVGEADDRGDVTVSFVLRDRSWPLVAGERGGRWRIVGTGVVSREQVVAERRTRFNRRVRWSVLGDLET